MSGRSGETVVSSDGRRLALGKLVKSGGAGSVYLLPGSPQQVAKIYHAGDEVRVYERKVEAMLELTPELPELVDGGRRFVQIAWPQALLRDARGRFLGFLMPVVDVDATSELEVILQERQARAAGLPTGLGAKVTLAANLAAVIAALHAQHHYLVDLKPVNLRFYRDTLYMAMLDCDGFSIQGSGERFLAPQFTIDYLAPEFHARGITAAGEKEQDRFAMAVVIFQLMNFGIHPFSGKPANDRVPTDIPGRIAGRWYAYGLRPNAAIAPSPVSAHASMPMELRRLFDQAFDGSSPSRPSAAEWSEVLKVFAQRSSQRLLVCGKDSSHQHFAGQACAACARATLLKTTAKQQAARGPRVERPPPMPQWARPTPPTAVRPRAAYRRGQPFPTSGLPPLPSLTPSPAPVGWVAQLVYLFWTRGSIRARKAILSVLVILVFLFFKWLSGLGDHSPRYSYRSPPPALESSAGVSDTAATPAAATGMPPSPDLQVTLTETKAAAEAMNRRSFSLAATSMTRLRNDVARHPAPAAGTDTVYNALLRQYSSNGLLGIPAEREEFRSALRSLQLSDPSSAPVAYQLGWWSLIDGDAAAARTAFTQAIRANPDLPEAWYGLGVASTDEDDRQGLLAVAESLFSDEPHAQVVRDAFSRNTLVPMAIDPFGFSKMQARARRLALLSQGKDVPEDLQKEALDY